MDGEGRLALRLSGKIEMKVVVTGTSRGIGLALARIVLGQGHELLAVARSSSSSPELASLQTSYPGHCRLVDVDLRQPSAAAAIGSAIRDWVAIDLLVNCAGILTEGTQREDFIESFLVNAIAPFELASALLPRLKLSTNPRVIHLTSRLGSIADNRSGGHYAYRASKVALNMINRSLALDHPWLTTVVVHPGWVRTRMGGGKAPVEPMDSASGIWRLALGLAREHSGRFFDYQGRELPW
jgi:NAD(P)-dependent dehydrogenase (short-subunit alcohol dehydrogenase family)